jgi:hypothetical protein
MSIELTNTMKERMLDFSDYYAKFLEDGSCKAVKSRALLEEIAALTIKIERDIYLRLIELGYIEEASEFLKDEEQETQTFHADVIDIRQSN